MHRQPLRVAIASPQLVVRRGVASVLADFPDRVHLLELDSSEVRIDEPQVVLYDVAGMRTDDGRELAGIAAQRPVVVALCPPDRPELATHAVEAGARATASLSASADELVGVLESAVVAQLSGVTPRVAGAVLSVGDLDLGLTQREQEVLSLIAAGRSNQEIASALYISINSVKTYIRACYRKIGVTSRSQAVLWALRKGIA